MKAALTAIALLLPAPALADCVVLLHGLARTETSFIVMEEVLKNEGYTTFRTDYPSTELDIAELAEETLPYAARIARTVLTRTDGAALNPALEQVGKLLAAHSVLFALGLALPEVLA